MSKFNPFAPVRVAGPLGEFRVQVMYTSLCGDGLWYGSTGPYLLSSFRRDLSGRFGEDFMNYVYHCAAQNPTSVSHHTHST